MTDKTTQKCEFTKLERELFKLLRDFYNDKAFVIGIMNSIRTDAGRKEMIEFIHKGEGVTVMELTLMSIDIGRKEDMIIKRSYEIIQGDITKLDCDAIVNAANSTLLGGGGVDGAIHSAAGKELYEECLQLHGCNTGEAKITKGYKLPAKYIIHTVGPIYSDSDEDDILLSRCYKNSLDLAKKYNIHTIAFPAISCGAYGYPVEKAAKVAAITVVDWLKANSYDMFVTFCCYNERDYDVYVKTCNSL